jgi:hypothetical protein
MMRSSQPKSQVSGAGWMRAQENTAGVTMLTPARFISSTSSAQTSSGH